MNITVGLRALGLLAFVAAATAVIVHPALAGTADVLSAAMALSHP